MLVLKGELETEVGADGRREVGVEPKAKDGFGGRAKLVWLVLIEGHGPVGDVRMGDEPSLILLSSRSIFSSASASSSLCERSSVPPVLRRLLGPPEVRRDVLERIVV